MIVPDTLLHRSATDLLRIAASVCDARFGVVRLFGRESIATDPALSFTEASLARRVEAQEDVLVVLGEAETQAIAPQFRFYAAVKLFNASAQLRGTFAVLDDRPRLLSETQRQLLIQIAGRLTGDLEMINMIRTSREEQSRLYTAVDAAPVAVYAYQDGRFSYVNRKFAETLGYSSEELLALDSVTDIIVEDQRELVQEMVRRREAGDDREVRFVTKVRCRDGTLLDAEIHGSAVNVDGGRIIIGAAVDVTASLAANRQLAEREEHFRALTENVMDIIEIVSDQHVLTYVSPSIERVLGYKPEERLGKPAFETIHPEDRHRFSAALTELAGGVAFGPQEYRVQHKNGTWRVLEIIGTNLLHHQHIRGLVMNLRDITDRQRMERELEQLNRISSLGRLATHVAHEFNNVLMGIQPMVDVVRRRAADDSQLLRSTDLISASIKRGKRITNDILRFGHPAQLALRPVKVQDLIQQASDEIASVLPAGIRLDVKVSGTPLHVSADPAQLSQVLINLALNAKDAMQAKGGTLTISARPGQNTEIGDGDPMIHFAVTDTGEGIADENLPYVFEPLFTTKKSGTGLGLSIVYQIVTAHHGHISVESEPGKGTTFHISIPALLAVEPQDPSEKQDQSAPPRSLRVLIVEDDEVIASGLRWSLEAQGIDARSVRTGAEALPAVEEFRPDVMLLDLLLPDEDGRSVYQRVSAAFPLPVIFSSGHASESEIDRLVGDPHVAFLMKPYSTEELLSTIDRLVGLPRHCR